MTTTEKVEDLKNKGNTAFSSGKFQEAVDLFTEAIALDSKNAVLFSNRSAAWASLKEYQGALKDAEEAIILRPDWPKGWGRKGAALAGRGELEEAKQAYERALELEPENGTLKKAIETVERELDRQKSTSTSRTAEGEGSRLVENIFADSTMWERLRADPKMASYLEDPNFVTILNELRSDPKSLTNHIKDPRVMQAFAVMLGVQMKTPEQFQAQERQAATNLRAQQASSPSPAKASPSIEDSNKVEALKEKEQGNEAYKQKNFEAALQHYEHAISLDPNNVALLNNKAAVYFEQGHYDECISQCQQAVERGREIYADFKLIAKALGRIGSAWEQKGDLDQAISYYHKSLTEHRTPDILAKLKDAERAQEAARKAAYHSPALAETERNAGNELFKQGKYDEALQHYSEAIRRDENDPRAWANRAACYLKLTAVPEGLRDCDRALILDPNFVKAHIRKAALLHLKRDYSEALTVLDQASTADREHRHITEIQQLITRIYQDIQRNQATSGEGSADGASEEEVLRRAANNPEIREILADPVMMQILRQMQSDPRAAAEHLRNPEISAKVRKLVAAGIVRTQQ